MFASGGPPAPLSPVCVLPLSLAFELSPMPAESRLLSDPAESGPRPGPLSEPWGATSTLEPSLSAAPSGRVVAWESDVPHPRQKAKTTREIASQVGAIERTRIVGIYMHRPRRRGLRIQPAPGTP
jgi:hypothetical protein